MVPCRSTFEFKLKVGFFFYSCTMRTATLLSTGSTDSTQNPSPKIRPVRKRRPTRKVTEDATADVPVATHPPTSDNLRRQDSVIHNSSPPAAPAANLPEYRQEGHAAASAHPVPTCDEGANPFLTAAGSCRHESCDNHPRNFATPSTERQFYAVSPSTPSRSPYSPCVGQRSIPSSITRRRRRRSSLGNGPVGHKHRRAARDVWTFFEDNDSKRSCLFCK